MITNDAIIWKRCLNYTARGSKNLTLNLLKIDKISGINELKYNYFGNELRKEPMFNFVRGLPCRTFWFYDFSVRVMNVSKKKVMNDTETNTDQFLLQSFVCWSFITKYPILSLPNNMFCFFQDQFAFRPTGSTTLIFLIHSISSFLQYNQHMHVISFDFSKAFDSVRHHTLFQKCQNTLFLTFCTTGLFHFHWQITQN